MRRVIVIGGLGLFGRTAAERLAALGIDSQTASRGSGADVRVDAEDGESIRAAIRAGDLVVDAAGPFQSRSTTLLEAAIDVGFDVLDINDNLAYAEQTIALAEQIEKAGIRVLGSASSVSAVSAAAVNLSGISNPVRLRGFIVPASRHTANTGSAISLIGSVGRPVRTLRAGELRTLRGWDEARRFPMPQPVGNAVGRLFESADAVHLPRIWSSLVDVATYVDTNTWGVNTLLRLAGRSSVVRRLLESQVELGTRLSRSLGSNTGGLGYEIEDADGKVKRLAILASEAGFVTAVAPAILAARAIVEDRFEPRGLVKPDEHVETDELVKYLESSSIRLAQLT